jgi:hypothetical protein
MSEESINIYGDLDSSSVDLGKFPVDQKPQKNWKKIITISTIAAVISAIVVTLIVLLVLSKKSNSNAIATMESDIATNKTLYCALVNDSTTYIDESCNAAERYTNSVSSTSVSDEVLGSMKSLINRMIEAKEDRNLNNIDIEIALLSAGIKPATERMTAELASIDTKRIGLLSQSTDKKNEADDKKYAYTHAMNNENYPEAKKLMVEARTLRSESRAILKAAKVEASRAKLVEQRAKLNDKNIAFVPTRTKDKAREITTLLDNANKIVLQDFKAVKSTFDKLKLLANKPDDNTDLQIVLTKVEELIPVDEPVEDTTSSISRFGTFR